MGRIQSGVTKLLSCSIADNTRCTYITALNAFSNFRTSYKLSESWPADFQHIILFISFCFERGNSPKSIKTYISGLNYWHKLHGWYDICANFVIVKLLEGCSRARKIKDNRAPITKGILQILLGKLQKVCYNDYETKLFSAIWTLAYFGLFRVSELVASSSFRKYNQLLIGDIQFPKNMQSVSLRLNRSKTNQSCSPNVIKIPAENESALCPVKALTTYLKMRPNLSGPLFCHADGKAVTRSQFSSVLSKCIFEASLNTSCYKTHSFRIGRATDLAALGLSETAIKAMGRWSSSAYKLYIR